MRLILGLLIGLVVGWSQAHKMVATECKKLGGFFVYEEVFECVEMTEKKGDKL